MPPCPYYAIIRSQYPFIISLFGQIYNNLAIWRILDQIRGQKWGNSGMQKSGKELAESLLPRQLCHPCAAIVETLAANFHWLSMPWSAVPKSRWNCNGMVTGLGNIFARRSPTILQSLRCLTKKATISPYGRNGEIITEPQQARATMTQVVLKGASLSFVFLRIRCNILHYSQIAKPLF